MGKISALKYSTQYRLEYDVEDASCPIKRGWLEDCHYNNELLPAKFTNKPQQNFCRRTDFLPDFVSL